MPPSLDASLPSSQHVQTGRRRLQQQRLAASSTQAQGAEPEGYRARLRFQAQCSSEYRLRGSIHCSASWAVLSATEGEHQYVRGLRNPCPSYFLIGAMKCGTSSLNKLIMDSFPSSPVPAQEGVLRLPEERPSEAQLVRHQCQQHLPHPRQHSQVPLQPPHSSPDEGDVQVWQDATVCRHSLRPCPAGPGRTTATTSSSTTEKCRKTATSSRGSISWRCASCLS